MGEVPCVVCEGRDNYEKHLGRLERCPRCGFIAYREATAADISALYNEGYFTGGDYPDYLGQEPALRRSMRRHLRQMLRTCPASGSLLEIGCAYGLFLDEAKGLFDHVMGVDICEIPVRYARQELGVDARLGDVRALDLETASYDVVCMWDTIEHLPDPDTFLMRALELLRPGGRLFVTTGDIGSLNARARGASWRLIRPPWHLSYFSRSTISALLHRVGFAVSRVETAAYYHTLHGVLAAIQLRGGSLSRTAAIALSLLGRGALGRLGGWVNLGDIMFVEAEAAPRLESRGHAPEEAGIA